MMSRVSHSNPNLPAGAVSPLAELCSESPSIAIAEVVSVGAPPQGWSGRAPAFQKVTYQVKETIKGPKLKGKIDVLQAVVRGSPTAAQGDEPGLSRGLFKTGNALVLFLDRRDDGTLVSLDERIGASPATPEWVAQVRAACG
jgi:hypothetical protein